MPRCARRKSETGIYHVMLRGIDKQNIYFDDKDKSKFLLILKDCRDLCGFQLFAYCLLDNHAHILLRETKENIDKIFKRVGIRYAYYFNRKYKRVGPLFQDRFKSEPVEDDAYLSTVLGYIHLNPVKAGLCGSPGDYNWSSYRDYLKSEGITDVGAVLPLLNSDGDKAKASVLNPESKSPEPCLEISDRNYLNDDDVHRIVEKLRSEEKPDFSKMDDMSKRKVVAELKSAGLSLRQISAAIGISLYAVRKL